LIGTLRRRAAAGLLFSLALAACASVPPSQADIDQADRAAAQAAKMVGKPYRYGGSTPAGFDCSGLIHFSYTQAGVSVPRSTEEQRRSSKHIRVAELRRGDLLFFHQEGKKNSHVGIYLGGGEFVHAPSSGKRVRSDRLDSRYWREHLSEVRRINT
jgi:murein DD-endopeptidase